ncbi:MAG TPA: YcaO-like family protein [Myxococcales bacterium]|nr:YcaO-like family protein [Myxococcales bacterium]
MESILGITRVARVTGLDRSGVEVACAVRPGGHVLQVSNGKGATWQQARASAISEAAELWAAERPSGASLVYAALRELRHAWAPPPLAAPRLWSRDLRIAWVRARELGSAREVLVPAQAVYCPPQGAPPLGPAVFRWSSNGMGAHPRRRLALLHALLEVCERDQLARVLPHGWTPRAVATRKLDVSRVPLWRQLRDARLEAHLFDLSGRMPVAAALLVDLDQGPVPLTAGYACALTPARAVQGALLEAAQSRLTDVHGAREDVGAPDFAMARALRAACERARPSRTLRQMPTPRRVLLPSKRVAVVALAAKPLHVVKVISPDLRVSELL